MSCWKEAGGEVEIQFCGNPGYVVGLPVVSGRRTTEYPLFKEKWFSLLWNSGGSMENVDMPLT